MGTTLGGSAAFPSISGGPPATGTYAVGDWVVDPANVCMWICTVAGSPGTWDRTGVTNEEIASVETDATQPITSGTLTDVTSLSLTNFVVGSRPAYVHAVLPFVNSSASTLVRASITDASNVIKSYDAQTCVSTGAGGFTSLHAIERISGAGTYSRKLRIEVVVPGTYGAANLTVGGGAGNKFWSRLYVEQK